jgi:bifunctional non-homologous end joining protein LigD
MPKKIFPAFVPPMMAESAKTPFDSPDWIFEIKLDGYRAITVFDSAGKAHLWSRNGLPLETKFPAVATAVSKLKLRSTILDGEVVAVDENGIPRFQVLQRFQKQPTAPTLYYVFDVLWSKGDDLTQKSVLERRKVLERVLRPAAGIQLGSYVEAEGRALFELTKEKGMEGIIAKHKDSNVGLGTGFVSLKPG